MQELIDHIQDKSYIELYRIPSGGLTGFDNIMGLMYGYILNAARRGADTLILGEDKLAWLKNNNVLATRPWSEIGLGDAFRIAMGKIIARDPIVAKHLKMSTDEPQKHIYVFNE